MASVVISGDTSGAVTITAPAVAGTPTLTLPTTTGTILTTASTAVVTQAMLSTNVAGNGPAFSASRNGAGNQTVSSATYTKVLFPTEAFDTNSNFASSTFTPTVEGYYQINAKVGFNSTGESLIQLYKNGAVHRTGNDLVGTVYGLVLSALVYANGTTDYFEVYGYPGAGTIFDGGPGVTYFEGFLARSA